MKTSEGNLPLSPGGSELLESGRQVGSEAKERKQPGTHA